MKDFINYTLTWFIVIAGIILGAVLSWSFIVWDLPDLQRVIEVVPEITRIALVLSVFGGLMATIFEAAKK